MLGNKTRTRGDRVYGLNQSSLCLEIGYESAVRARTRQASETRRMRQTYQVAFSPDQTSFNTSRWSSIVLDPIATIFDSMQGKSLDAESGWVAVDDPGFPTLDHIRPFFLRARGDGRSKSPHDVEPTEGRRQSDRSGWKPYIASHVP